MARTGYLVIIYQDINPSSPTYNQTREERTQDDENCPTSAVAHWIEDTRYCELNERGMYTGYEITVYRDVEPLSPTYNETTQVRELNTTDCEEDETTPDWRNIGDPYCREIVYMPGGLLGNDGYMIQQQQDMNEYSPTAEEIREVEIQDLEHCPLPNTEAVWETVSESCHIVEYQGQLVYDGTKDIIRTNTNQYSPTWNNNIPETVNVEDLINCPPAMEIQYRWVESSGQYVCVGYDKYSVEKKQRSTDGGTTWEDVVPSETRQGSLIEHNSEDCGYVPPVYSSMYLTFVAIENETFTFTGTQTNSLSYSLDEGQTWTALASGAASPTVIAGNKIMWKGNCVPSTSSSPYGIGTFSSTGRFDVECNVMSLLYGDNFEGQTDLTGKSYVFHRLFYNNANLVNAENLSLPATTLAESCYNNMFRDCTSLTTAPQLPATTLAEYCYASMFRGCTSLTTAPQLPATTLVEYCYNNMFRDCTSLTTAPQLPATTLAQSCYDGMFYGCTNLTTAPALPATTMAQYCYNNMFRDCTSLTTAPQLPATTMASCCYQQMFQGCTSLTTAPALPATTMETFCYNNMFRDCTNLTTAPQLPSTTLAQSCYAGMFYGCTSLTTAPALPATTMAQYCYENMFYGCTSLTTAPALPATTIRQSCYSGMFYGCTSLTTAPELPATILMANNTIASNCYRNMFSYCTSLVNVSALPATTLASNCYQGMFKGCTSLTTAPEILATRLGVSLVIGGVCKEMFADCTSLNYIKCLATDISATDCTLDWVKGVAANGTFIKAAGMNDWTTGDNGIPSGWTVIDA